MWYGTLFNLVFILSVPVSILILSVLVTNKRTYFTL